MIKYLMVGAGGFLGAVARFWVAEFIYERFGARFPLGTLVVNCTGCFAIGLVMTMLTTRTGINPLWRYLVPIGFIGGYTTFSSFEYETIAALRAGALFSGLLNVVLSVTAGFIFVWLGIICGEWINRTAPVPATTASVVYELRSLAPDEELVP